MQSRMLDGENMAYIRKLASGWRAEVERNGMRTSKVLPTKREAQAWALEMESKAKRQKQGWRTFKTAAETYRDTVSSKKQGEKWERLRIEAFIAHFGDAPLGDIDAPQIAEWRETRLKTVQASTVLREVNLLRHIFTMARTEWHWIDHDPFSGVRMPSAPPPRTAKWGWRDIRRVLRHASGGGQKTKEVGQAFHIALRTGMRLQEALAAPSGFDKARQVATVKTKTGVRQIPVGRLAAKLLDRPPFTVDANEASTLFRRLTKQLRIDGLTFHDARATALTHLARKVPVEVLAKVSGHRDISLLVNTYYRPTPDEVARMI